MTTTATAVSIPSVFAGKRVAILGAGKMGGILLRSLLDQGLLSRDKTCATVQHPERAQSLSKDFNIPVTTNNLDAVKGADVILIGLKPQQVKAVLEEVRPNVHNKQLFVSVAASVPTSYMEKALAGQVPVIRAMPNTPS